MPSSSLHDPLARHLNSVAVCWFWLTIGGVFYVGLGHVLPAVYAGYSTAFFVGQHVFCYFMFVQMIVNWLCVKFIKWVNYRNRVKGCSEKSTSSVERHRGLTTSHFHTQLDSFVSKQKSSLHTDDDLVTMHISKIVLDTDVSDLYYTYSLVVTDFGTVRMRTPESLLMHMQTSTTSVVCHEFQSICTYMYLYEWTSLLNIRLAQLTVRVIPVASLLKISRLHHPSTVNPIHLYLHHFLPISVELLYLILRSFVLDNYIVCFIFYLVFMIYIVEHFRWLSC